MLNRIGLSHSAGDSQGSHGRLRPACGGDGAVTRDHSACKAWQYCMCMAQAFWHDEAFIS